MMYTGNGIVISRDEMTNEIISSGSDLSRYDLEKLDVDEFIWEYQKITGNKASYDGLLELFFFEST